MDPNLTLMDFQEETSTRMAASARAFIVHDPGTGKTPTAVRACMKADAQRVLVFCPVIATGVWQQHFKDWSTYRDIRVADKDAAHSPNWFVMGTGVRIIPYSRCRFGSVLLDAATVDPWDVVILDEAHALKTANAQRTKAVYGNTINLKHSPLERAGHVWLLTGTPILNHPGEFWTHLHALAPDTINNMPRARFIERYCVSRQTPYGVQIVGARNTSELAARIKPLIDRKRLKDVIDQMPDLRIVEHALPADTPIDSQLRNEILHASQVFGDALAVQEMSDNDALLTMIQSSSIAFSTLRRLIGRAKVPGTIELIQDFMHDSPDAKLIVFAHHREVITDLDVHLKRSHPALVIHGGTPANVRARAIELFQTDPKYRLIILAIDTAGEAITLHAAHNIIMLEPSPVPARNHQAIARAYRKGQKNHVLVRFISLPGFLDARITTLLARKTRDIAKIVDPAGGSTTPDLSVQDEARAAFPG